MSYRVGVGAIATEESRAAACNPAVPGANHSASRAAARARGARHAPPPAPPQPNPPHLSPWPCLTLHEVDGGMIAVAASDGRTGTFNTASPDANHAADRSASRPCEAASCR